MGRLGWRCTAWEHAKPRRMDTSVWCFHGRDSFTEVQLRTADIQAHLFPWHGCLPWVCSDTLSGFIEGRGWVSLFAAGLEGERIEVCAVWCQLTQDV